MTRSAKVMRAASRVRSRRQDYSSSTRNTLVERAVDLFTERGYAGTSLDEVVAAARVTKGALYHHYSGKQALFEAVFEATEDDAVRYITQETRSVQDPWESAIVGVRAFMEVCQQPRFRRIVMQEGPVALGFDRFREADERNTYGLVRDIVLNVLTPYDVPAGIMETFARVFYGAMTSAGMSVASAEDPGAAGREVETVIGIVLAGLRQLAESGVDLLDRSSPAPIASRG
jgi:AcrR family transcriptional regulator